MSDDTFDRLFDRFGVLDELIWGCSIQFWFRLRFFSDGAWLEGERIEAVEYWGC